MTSSLSIQQQTIGILGGGQLGRMLIQSAMDFNLEIHILDPDENAPCRSLAAKFICGKLTNYDTVMAFGAECDLITIEIENVNIEALKDLERAGKKVFPEPRVIELIQDKRVQKQFYTEHNIPTAEYELTEGREHLKQIAQLPVVNKLGREGYDGRGVQILKTESDLENAFEAPGLIEKLIEFEKEIAVIVAQNSAGETVAFPAVEMMFHPEANLVEFLFAPADLTEEMAAKAEHVATDVIRKLEMTGLLAVEMFVTRDGEILVNEVAPRPHNSGHQTIEGNVTSQYEQHLRAICNLPLGDPALRGKSAMVNILGEEGHTGPALFSGLEEVMAIPGVHVHLYGKKLTKPFRKMGHVTIEDNDITRLREKVEKVKHTLKVVSQP
jgi:5-(carboxyamino)imidazole ribonucleotide synthase